MDKSCYKEANFPADSSDILAKFSKEPSFYIDYICSNSNKTIDEIMTEIDDARWRLSREKRSNIEKCSMNAFLNNA